MAEADLIMLRGETIDTTKDLTITHPVERWKTLTFEAGKYSVKEIIYPIIKGGKLVAEMPSLKEIRAFCDREKETFWDEYKRLINPHIYKVDLSDGLYDLKTRMIKEIRKK